MTTPVARRELIGLRLLAHGLVPEARTEIPHDSGEAVLAAVRGTGAHQGQDLPGVIASLALRTTGDPADVTDAFTAGTVVRGYPMRGTVFAVAAADLRWMTELCAAPAIRAAIRRRAQLGLTDDDVERAGAVLLEAAEPHSVPGTGKGLPRAEAFRTWEEHRIDPSGGRGYHLLVHLISTGAIAYGPWNDGDTAIVAADPWLPAGTGLADLFDDDRTAACAALLRTYLLSHGPVTLRDFAWWTKLPLALIRQAFPLIAHVVEDCTIPGTDEPAYLRPGLRDEFALHERAAMREILLPGFDELVLGQPDRLALMDRDAHDALVPGNNGVFKRAAIRRGQVVGTWTRTGPAGRRRLVLTPLTAISPAQERRFESLFVAFPYTAP